MSDLHGLMRRLSPDTFRPHRLHAADRDWPETNCNLDVWIEVLHALGAVPEAALGSVAALDFDGDRFTFVKVPPGDLRALFGLQVEELVIYDRFDAQLSVQTARGHLTLVVVDSFHLPDTRGVAYHTIHEGTTIGIARIDPAAREIDYFHNSGFHRLGGDDYDALFPADAAHDGSSPIPYVEMVKVREAPPRETLGARARSLLVDHVSYAPRSNPVGAFASVVTDAAAHVAGREPQFFHTYAFSTVRMLGSSFLLFADHLDWLHTEGALADTSAADAARRVSAGAKSFQFQFARAVSRRRFDALVPALAPVAQAWDDCLGALRAELGV